MRTDGCDVGFDAECAHIPISNIGVAPWRVRLRNGKSAKLVPRFPVYLRVSRQPAASASSTEQNQRVPLLICILICEYQRLVVVW